MTTTTTTFKSSELGTVALTTYVDPHPGLKGTDKVAVVCGMCHDGIYTGYSGLTWEGRGGLVAPWCFRCNGTNRRYISVSTARRNAKRDAFRAEYAVQIEANRIAREAEANARIAAAEFEAAWEAAHAEQARRAALVGGFLGQVGEKVTGTGTVQVAKYIEGSWNRSSSMFLIIKLDSGQVVKVFGSSQTLFALERGYRVEITGKVKDHQAYQGQDQTVLSHAKAVILDED